MLSLECLFLSFMKRGVYTRYCSVSSERIPEYQYDFQYLLHDDVSYTKNPRICMYESDVHVKCTQLCLLLSEYVTFPAWWRS